MKLNYLKKYPNVFSYPTKHGDRFGYRLTFYDSVHHRHEKQKRGFDSPDVAYRASLKAQLDIADHEADLLKAETVTVRQWAESFVKANATNWKKSTLQTYETNLNQYILPALGDLRLSQLTKSKYQILMINKMVDNGYKRWTIKGTHTALMTLLNAAVDEGLLNRNKLSRTPIPDTGHIQKRIMSQEELQKFNRQLDQEPLTTQLMMYTLEQTGMRQGELMGLRWEDIDLEDQKIHIKHTRDERGLRSPKTPNSVRTVPISANLVKIYKKYGLEQKKRHFAKGRKVTKTTFVLTSKYLNPLVNTAISLRLRNTLKRAGLGYLVGHFTAHTFRHMYASYLLNSGVEVSEVSAALGHSSPQITLSIYTEETPMKKDNLADKFNDLW